MLVIMRYWKYVILSTAMSYRRNINSVKIETNSSTCFLSIHYTYVYTLPNIWGSDNKLIKWIDVLEISIDFILST